MEKAKSNRHAKEIESARQATEAVINLLVELVRVGAIPRSQAMAVAEEVTVPLPNFQKKRALEAVAAELRHAPFVHET